MSEFSQAELDSFVILLDQTQHAAYERRLRAGLSIGEKCLYVVEIPGWYTKIGVSKNPDGRIATHRHHARAHGLDLGRIWVSGPHINALENERKLKRRSRTEYLNEGFRDVVARARKLTYVRAEAVSG